MSLLGSLLNPPGLAPHGFCLSWNSELVWLHAASDALSLLSDISIPLSLIWLLRRRQDQTHRWIVYLFVAFFLTGATVRGLAILMLWVPDYGLEGIAMAAAAVASVTTAAVVWIMVPRLVRMLSPARLTSLSTELSHTIAKQETTLFQLLGIEQKLRNSNSKLEKNVARHAADLRTSNTRLLELFAKRVATQELLAKSEAEYRASFEAGTIGRVQMEPLSGRLLRVNHGFATMLGYNVKDLVGHELWQFVCPDDRAAAVARFGKLLAGEIDTCLIEKRYLRRDGVRVRVRMSATVVMDPAVGVPRLALAEFENIDLRHDIQAALQATEVLLRLALQHGQFGVWSFDLKNDLFRVDEKAAAMTGGELAADTWFGLAGPEYAAWGKRIHPDDRTQRETRLQALFQGRSDAVQSEYRVSRANAEWRTMADRYVIVERDAATALPVRAVGVTSDLTRRIARLTEAQTARADLERSLRKRNTVLAHRHLLLREVYHRMHDTLQLIDVLFAEKTQQLSDRQALQTLSVQRNRIYALGFVHGKLMTSVEVETFDVAPFLHELCGAFLSNGGDRGVSLRVDADHLQVTLDYAIPLGLLVTELLTNCLSHAPSRMDGRITVGARRAANARITLIVSDGGIGPADEARCASFTTGLETRPVKDLMSQLGAELQLRSNDGLEVEVSIPDRHA